MKKLLALLLTICMVLTMLPITASAAEVASGKCGDNLTWVLSENVLTISGTGELTDPSGWETRTEEIVKVVIEEGVTGICEWAFSYMYSLKTVTIPDTVTGIGDGAFYNCSILDNVVIPDSITVMGEAVFSDCYNMTNITLPASLTKISDSTFKYCNSLYEIDIPESVTKIDRAAFYCCGLKNLVLPVGVTEIEAYAFYGCQLTSAVIPENVTKIGENAFGFCYSLGSIVFQGDAPAIHSQAFLEVTASAYYPANNATWSADKLQNYSGSITWAPYESEEDYQVVAQGICGDNLTWTQSFDGILTISGTGEMYENPWNYDTIAHRTCEVIMENGVTTIGKSAFNGFHNLAKVTIPDTVQQIGEGAFTACSALTSVVIPEGVTSIPDYLFSYCERMTSVQLPESITTIGENAFFCCAGIEEIEIPKNVTSIGESAFTWCSLKEITIPSGVTVIPYGAFYGNYLEIVTFEGDITQIGDHAFWGCNLTSMEIPASVTKIGDQAFALCENLKELWFHGDAPAISDNVFYGVTADAYYPQGNATWTEEVMQDYGGTITWVPYGDVEEEYSVKWATVNTTLTGSIDLNYYAVLSDNLVKDDTYVRFTCAGKTVDVPMADAVVSVKNGVTRYRFSCKIYAKQMTDTVTAQVMTSNGPVGEAKDYSVAEYCNALMNHSSSNAETIALCKAMMNYGAAAQTLFNYNLDKMANATLSEADKVLPGFETKAYAYSITGSEDGIKASGAKLILDQDVAIRVTFKLTGDKTIDQYTFTIDGKEVTPVADGDKYYIELDGIAASTFDEYHAFSVGGLTVNYSVLSYADMVYNSASSTDALIGLVNAMYAYYAATEAYVN